MSKKVIKNIAGLFLIIAVIILSLDIHSLDSERRIPASEVFDVDAYVEDFWKNRLPGRLADAVDIEYLVQLLKNDPDEAFDNYSNKLGISNTHYFYISGIACSMDSMTSIALFRSKSALCCATILKPGNSSTTL